MKPLLPLTVLCLLAGAGASGCRRALADGAVSRQVLEDFTLRQTHLGTPVWELRARTAVLEEDGGEAVLSEPRMEFFRGGGVVSRLHALSGRVRVDTHDVFLSSSVVLDAASESTTLRTESLAYSSKRQRFITDAEVRVQRPEGQLQGRGLEATPDLSEIRIFNQRSVVQEKPS